MGSDDFPSETQNYVLDLQKLFTFTETASFIDPGMVNQYSYKECTINQFLLCRDPNCGQTLNSSQIYLSNYYFNQSHSQAMRDIYSRNFQYLSIVVNNAEDKFDDAYLKITNNGQDQFPT